VDEFDAVRKTLAGFRRADDHTKAAEETDTGGAKAVDLETLRADWLAVNLESALPEIVTEFLDDASATVPQLVDAIDAGKMGETATLAHRLKSPAQTLHAGPLAELLGRIESESRSGNTEGVTALRARLDETFSAARRVLSAFLDSAG
jgi:HPt (histidine-containing phosphotransfer) domain-containing protein